VKSAYFFNTVIQVIAKSGLVAYGLMALDLGDHEDVME